MSQTTTTDPQFPQTPSPKRFRPLGLVSDIFFALPMRVLLIFMIGLFLAAATADYVYPQILPGIASSVSADISKMSAKVPSRAKALQLIAQHGLSWYYVSDNGRVNQSTAIFAPELPSVPKKSGFLDWKGGHYYESVSDLGHGQSLHLGFFAGSVLLPLLTSGSSGWTAALPAGYLSVLYLVVAVVFVAAMHLLVSMPLWKMSRFASSLFSSDDETVEHNLHLTWALSEVNQVAASLKTLRNQYNQREFDRISKEHSLRQKQRTLETEKENISKEFDDHIVKTHRSITELYTKESEEEFISALGRELDAIQYIDLICQKALDRLNDKFPTTITMGAFFVATKQNDRFRLQGSIGFDTATVEYLDDMDHHHISSELLSSGKAIIMEKRSFRDYGLEELGARKDLHGAIYLPLQFQGRNIGMMAIYQDQPHSSANERLRILRNCAELCSRELHRVMIYRQELEAARTDALTGMYNKKFFYELVPQLIEKSSANPSQHPVSFVMIDGDNFKQVNDTYGHQIGDQMLVELATLIRNTTRMTEYGIRPGRAKDYVIRYGGEEFLVVMENTSAGQAFNVAERIRTIIESKSDWPGGLARWTVSMGISTYPTDANNVDELMLLADAALYFVKEELGKNKCALATSVPKGFRARKYSAIGGELGIFDPAALLQSIAAAHKSGVLTVNASDGRKVWMLYENGHPMQARLGKFAGKNAIIEFITTFEDGKFNFQEIQPGSSGSGKRMASLTGSFNIQRGLERCLLDAALAQDNFETAKRVIRDVNVYLVPNTDFQSKLTALKQSPDAPSQEDLDTMAAIVLQIDDSSTLGDIFRALDHIPTAILWRAASIMVQHALVKLVEAEEHSVTTLKLKRLGVSSNDDGAAESDQVAVTNFNP